MRDCAAADDHTEPVISVIVVNWNTKDLLRECLASVATHLSERRHEIIVVDNASTDGSAIVVANEFPHVRLVCNTENLGFGRANNQAMAIGRGEFFLLLNSDARLLDASIAGLLEVFRRDSSVGVVGPRLENESRQLQPSAFRFGSVPLLLIEELGIYKLLGRPRVSRLFLGGYWDHASERPVDIVAGACMLIRKEVFESTGGFDPRIFLYGEEEEWCQRIKAAGWKIIYSPLATVLHIGHQTTCRFFGEEARIELCLESADRLLAARGGPIASLFIPPIRISGALLKLAKLGLQSWMGGPQATDDGVRVRARIVLRHYTRRVAS
jgi:GT2 family glycosyltransferase